MQGTENPQVEESDAELTVGPDKTTGEMIRTFAGLTCEPNEVISSLIDGLQVQ